MISFLEQIANAVSKENLPYLYKHCYIFPTKRAAVYFTNFLKNKHQDENFILPETLTIQEFVTRNTTYLIKDDWYLLLLLYQIQCKLTHTQQPFEKFLTWGKLILKDFDECDKYLIDTKLLFSALKAHKEMEDLYPISEELKKHIEKFILTNTSKKENTYKTEFIKTWNLLGEIYTELQQELQANKFAYEGMAYKEVLERLENNTLILPYEQVSFCGFNALSVCEEAIFKTIEQHYITAFWWDADELFMQNKFHEAGNFMRAYKTKFTGNHHHWIIGNELSYNKNINIVGISSDIGQTQFAAQQLSNTTKENTAIVLCNEQLLNPLLYALNSDKINITMGYNITQSDLYLFVSNLLNLFCNARITTTSVDFYHKDIQALSTHSFIKSKIEDKANLEKILPLFVPYMPRDVLQNFFPKEMLLTTNNPIEILEVITVLVKNTMVKDVYFFSTKDALLLKLNQLIQLLKEFTSPSEKDNIGILSKDALPYIVKQFIGNTSIPFESKPDSTVQIMGFLETRILDFEHLYILSLNDDNLPGTNKTNSFIPYNLRKIVGLPTFEQFDGINAYHFYRLLKRAKNIHLLYNNQATDNAGEKSRFIRQIQHDLCAGNNSINEYIATYNYAETPLNTEDDAPLINLQIKKTEEIKATLRVRSFSPSALKIYIKCPVQFYLKYVAGIDEPEEIEEEIDASVFGQILHKALELTYQPFLNKILKPNQIKTFSSDEFLQQKIKDACLELKLPKEIIQGSNQLSLKIIQRIAEKIIENDAQENIQILYTEKKFVWEHLQLEDGTFATLQGTFDRVDKRHDNSIRIVDYKTGSINIPAFPNMDDEEKINKFLDTLFIFDKTDYSAPFQGILYALMYYKLFDVKEIYVAYHHAKNMKDGMVYLNDGNPIGVELLLRFEKRLSTLLSNIIYKDEYFIPTNNKKAYDVSAYADLLGIDV